MTQCCYVNTVIINCQLAIIQQYAVFSKKRKIQEERKKNIMQKVDFLSCYFFLKFHKANVQEEIIHYFF